MERQRLVLVVILWGERAVVHHWTQAGKQHTGPLGTLSSAAQGQVPCSFCKLNPTSDYSHLRNCITALRGTISTNSTAAGGF